MNVFFKSMHCFLILIFSVVLVKATQPNVTNDSVDISIIKKRLYDAYLKSKPATITKHTIDSLLNTLQPNGAWKDFDYITRPKLGLKSIGHLHRLFILTAAYRDAGSIFYKQQHLKISIHSALNFWLKSDPETEHYWFNVIGVPRELTKILILLADELSIFELTEGVRILKKANENGVLMYGTKKATGQNMVWIARVQMEAACLQNNTAYLQFAIGEFMKEIAITTEEGIQPDWSFHQHGPQLYAGGYGLSFARDCSEIATFLTGTKFQLDRERVDILSHYILDGQQWMVRGNKIDYGTTGREIARIDKDAAGIALACDNMAQLSTIRRNEFIVFSSRIKNKIPIADGILIGNRHFWHSDFMVHQRKGFYTSVKMVSSRVFGSESGNGEGEKNYHLPDGCTYLLKSGEEYANIFPLWDWQKIPGVTCRINQKPLPLITFGINSEGKTSFVGGVSDGTYGMAAFNYDKDSVQARKAWFYFDEEYICLGAGIFSATNNPVITTINQCFKKGKIIISSNHIKKEVSKKSEHFNNPDWIFHDGVAYTFPAKANVNLLNENRTASWKVINKFIENPVTEKGDVFSLWLQHGVQPQNASYAYTVVPNIQVNKIDHFIAVKNCHIISNTTNLQAVKNDHLKMTQIAFWKAGEINIDGEIVNVNKPCLMILRQTNTSLIITISNPENKTLNVAVEVTGKYDDENCVSNASTGKTMINFNLPDGQFAGQSITQILSRSTTKYR